MAFGTLFFFHWPSFLFGVGMGWWGDFLHKGIDMNSFMEVVVPLGAFFFWERYEFVVFGRVKDSEFWNS